MAKEQYVAAIDLGSNSFHMAIAQESEHGSLRIIDRVREMIRLNAGLDKEGMLSHEAQQNALECLQRFRQRLNTIPFHRIRAVGTNTLRNANNSEEFLKLAEAALGHPISVISGYEEARLVYLGAAFDLATSGKKRLVVDIGGGSTELIIGEGDEPKKLDSLEIGCVSLTRKVFSGDCFSESEIGLAKKLVSRELEPVIGLYRNTQWQEAVGTSGTIKAIEQVSRELGSEQDWISDRSIEDIEKWIVGAKRSRSLSYVSDQRKPVFVAGFIILSTIFKTLGITRMDISQGALREGVAYDLIGRLHNEDSRFQGVASLADQFKPDSNQAKRVQNLSIWFYKEVAQEWNLQREINYKLLFWAAQLHEIGISVSHNEYHLHGAYIIENSDMDGFSRQVQKVLALLVQCHRMKIDCDNIAALPDEWADRVVKLSLLLRLAVTFYRGRSEMNLDEIGISAKGRVVMIAFPGGWDKDHPLTVFDLENEKQNFQALGYQLEIRVN